ncbi:MAG: ubiquitin carboxyl-hydrolase [Methylocystaceae bacterium]|nr:ubiquitin carboxyl-hydrolase [Methylocystaceae bacterium]
MAKDVEIIPPQKKKIGRPKENNYDSKIGDEICRLLTEGKSLNEICNSGKYPEMPCLTSVYKWLRVEPSFAQNYALAKEQSAETYAAIMMDIVNGPFNDAVEVNAARLKVDTYKWIAAKLKPRSYGERLQAELTGKDGGPIQTMSVTLDAGQLNPDARELLRQTLLTIKTNEE